MRKPAFCICQNKDADQLCGNCKADQYLCFRYIASGGGGVRVLRLTKN